MNFRKFKSIEVKRNFLIIVSIFIFFNLLAALMTDIKLIGFFGETQRKTGFLTYLSIALLALASSSIINNFNLRKIFNWALITGFLLAIYGLMQTSGIDFVQWNNPYNSIISTVGNPNFAAAIMAMMATILIGLIMSPEFSKLIRCFAGITFMMLLFAIYLSEARQGLISLALGGAFIVGFKIYQHNKKYGILSFATFIILGLISILGMLQIGPLTSFLYKSSVSVRGYYWRAGLQMFKDNPWFGVGLDRYGYNFKLYREVNYPLTYGFDITSSNAHNVPIQLLSTGGLFVGISYIALTLFIAYRGYIALRINQQNHKILVAGIVGSWLAYQAQSIISIDNNGISVWGWILGGAVVALSVPQTTNNLESGIKTKNNNNLVLLQPMISAAICTFAIILSFNMYQGEKYMFETRMYFNPSDSNSKGEFKVRADKAFNAPFQDENYKVQIAGYLITSGFVQEGMQKLESINKSDPKNLDCLLQLAYFNEQMQKLSEANIYRKNISELDPFNTRNYLQMGRNYKALGDLQNMKFMLNKINEFDKVSEMSKNANSELL